MALDWDELSRKSRICLVSGMIGCPVLSIILWRLRLPYTVEILWGVVIASWTAAIFHKRRSKKPAAKERVDDGIQ